MSYVRIIAGLGNPGPDYEGTKHNIGFELVDTLVSKVNSQARWVSKFGALTLDLKLEGESVIIVKPQEYMNLSGQSIGRFCSFFKIEPKQLLVVHDEVDLGFGIVRLKEGGGDAGHNGLKSITECFGSSNYLRLRMGVGRPPAEHVGRDTADWVLSRFTEKDYSLSKSDFDKLYAGFVAKGVDACLDCVKSGIIAAQRKYNQKTD